MEDDSPIFPMVSLIFGNDVGKTCNFKPFSAVFQSFLDDGRLIIRLSFKLPCQCGSVGEGAGWDRLGCMET